MADVSQDQSWRSPTNRGKVIAQIDEALCQAGNPLSKTSAELENHVFIKAKTKDEYLSLVAKLIIYIRNIESKQKPAMGPVMVGPPMPGQAMGGMPGQPIQTQGGAADPINALRTLTTQGPGQGQPMPGPMTPGMGMQPQMRPFSTYTARAAHLGMQSMGGPATMPVMRPDSQPFIMQGPQSGPGAAQPMGPGMPVQISSMSPVMAGGGNMGVGHPGMVSRQPNPGSMYGMGREMVPNQANMQQPVQSPAAVSTQPMVSPATLTMIPSPSPSGTNVTPSPVGKGLGAPSPVGSLNTPGNPLSMGLVASPAPALNPAEEQAYLEKLQQLQKYVPPLRRMIEKMQTEDEGQNQKRTDQAKLEHLLNILVDSNKRVPLSTLLKCEQALEKLHIFQGSTSLPSSTITTAATTTSSTLTTSRPGEQHICSPLFDAILANIKFPMLNHTLRRTFGPAVEALHGPPIRSPSPPAKKQKTDTEKSDPVISNVLQGEIARLDHRFKVTLDPLFHTGSKTVHLICKLDDRNLPSVPPIMVTVPENYPASSPICDSNNDDYNGTPFLETVQKSLNSQLLRLPDRFSVTALLDTWEMSIRRAFCQTVA